MTDEDMTPEEKEQIIDLLSKSNIAPSAEDKHNVHSFLFRVATSTDTTKLGFLKDEEVGTPKHPTRAFQEFALTSRDIINNPMYEKHFRDESEIVTSTSLSRDGFLVKQATTTTKQLADITKTKKENKGWFKKKEPEEPKLQT